MDNLLLAANIEEKNNIVYYDTGGGRIDDGTLGFTLGRYDSWS